jgi:hypothetical protein
MWLWCGTKAEKVLAVWEGFTAASTAQTAQYDPKIPNATVKIVVLLTRKTTKSAFTSVTFVGNHPLASSAANN